MRNDHYTPLSGKTRLIAAATSAVFTFSIFAAIAVGLTGGDFTRHWAAVVPAASAILHPA